MYLFTVDRRFDGSAPSDLPPNLAFLVTGDAQPTLNGVWRTDKDGAVARDPSVLAIAPSLGKIRVTVLEDDSRWEFTYEPGSDLSSVAQNWVQVHDPDPGAERPMLAELKTIDEESIRSLRAVAAGTGTADDESKLAELERRAAQLRYDVWPLLPSDQRSPERPPAPEA